MVTDLQKRAVQAIVNVFETGHPQGDYGKVTLLPDDGGHLTYGRSQTTLASGNLYLLIGAYCEAPGAQFAAGLRKYLPGLADRDTRLDGDRRFRDLLREAGDDPVMHHVQDQFFDRVYWGPSVRNAAAIGVEIALGVGVVYDSCVHGSWRRMRDRTNRRHGSVAAIGARAWVARYVEERRAWLATHPNALLHRTVYRMDAFRKLIGEGNWDLKLPFSIRGIEINGDILSGAAPVRVSAHDDGERTLLLRTPRMEGADVKAVQRALREEGYDVSADGVFGLRTDEAVRRFQEQSGLTVDGIVGPATRAALGL